DGAAAKAEGKPREILIEAHRTIGLPRLTPDRTGTALAGRVEVGRQVLNVLRQRERARFQDQNAVAMGRVDVEKMRRRDCSKTSSPDYDEIERSGIGMDGQILTSRCLVQRVADVAADIVEREGGRESDGGGHGCLPFFVRRVTSRMGCDDMSWLTSSEQFTDPRQNLPPRTVPR